MIHTDPLAACLPKANQSRPGPAWSPAPSSPARPRSAAARPGPAWRRSCRFTAAAAPAGHSVGHGLARRRHLPGAPGSPAGPGDRSWARTGQAPRSSGPEPPLKSPIPSLGPPATISGQHSPEQDITRAAAHDRRGRPGQPGHRRLQPGGERGRRGELSASAPSACCGSPASRSACCAAWSPWKARLPLWSSRAGIERGRGSWPSGVVSQVRARSTRSGRQEPAYYSIVLAGLAASLGVIASTLPLLERITGPENRQQRMIRPEAEMWTS